MKNKNEKIIYEITETTIQVNEGESIKSYGIVCKKGNETLKIIPDISPNKTAVKKLTGKMNKGNLHPAQLEEVLEDELDDLI